MTGYASSAYAHTLAEFGRPRHLPACDGWLLERPLPGGAGCDAFGPYPLFACRDWAALPADLETLSGQLVSVVLVADPFGGGNLGDGGILPTQIVNNRIGYAHHKEGGELSNPAHLVTLQAAFPDLCRPFKQHFIAGLALPPGEFVSPHHQRTARAAARKLHVRAAEHPPALLPAWLELYAHLVERHRLSGLHAFSPPTFAALLDLPDLAAFTAEAGGEIVAAHLWIVQGRVAYSHLAASSPAGYRLSAAYALHAFALDYFRGRVDWLDWGGAAGEHDQPGGLAWFKRGWASAALPSYLCGRILDRPRYATLSSAHPHTSYFPAYRYPTPPTP